MTTMKYTTFEALEQNLEAQAAQIDMMMDCIKKWSFTNGTEDDHMEYHELIASINPNEALQAFAEKVREQCAHIIEAQDVDPSFKHRMAEAIRNLKELPK